MVDGQTRAMRVPHASRWWMVDRSGISCRVIRCRQHRQPLARCHQVSAPPFAGAASCQTIGRRRRLCLTLCSSIIGAGKVMAGRAIEVPLRDLHGPSGWYRPRVPPGRRVYRGMFAPRFGRGFSKVKTGFMLS